MLFQKTGFKSNYARTIICLRCKISWFCQMDSLTMGASLAVNVKNFWMKPSEHQIKSTRDFVNKLNKIDLEACFECNSRVFNRRKRVECQKCEIWFYAECQNGDDQFYAKTKDKVWNCYNEKKINKIESVPETERQLFKRYAENVICIVSVEQESLLFKKSRIFNRNRTNEIIN